MQTFILFINISVGWPSSVLDAKVFTHSKIFNYLKNGGINENQLILGDSACPIVPFLRCPYKDNEHLTIPHRRFNKTLSSVRC